MICGEGWGSRGGASGGESYLLTVNRLKREFIVFVTRILLSVCG